MLAISALTVIYNPKAILRCHVLVARGAIGLAGIIRCLAIAATLE
jgi:hypothetical protein